ncbi:sensor histidine kinase [Deinococcus marmoris]|uniref:histidine kinase n=1 Tax=Deinococcus marmoris TaxID=249408 RepID=A0A1U7NRZ1_9DEIO|nr:sensor histidine kinase [Deinococcus marmoris]OLV15693.1 two-component system sensor kinase [Deinococcus marmoris]
MEALRSGWALVACLPALILFWRWPPHLQPPHLQPQRLLFWQRGVLLALIPLGIASVQVAQSQAAFGPVWWPLLTLWAVGISYVLTLIRTDDLDTVDLDTGRLPSKAFERLLLVSLLATTASLLILSPSLQFFVAVTTMLFLGMHQPLGWHLRYTLPIVAVFVWLFSLTASPSPGLLDALSNAAGLLMTAVFGVLLRRSRQLVEELETANTKLALQAAQAEELAVLRERSRLARELHDTLGHALTTITVQLEAAELSLERRPDKARILLGQSRELSRAATSELRLSLSDLRSEVSPSTPDQSMLAQLSVLAQPEGLPAVQLNLTDVQLSPQQQHALIRIASEAVQNARRHAHARQISVELRQTPQDTRLSVSDDGQGFDTRQPTAPGHYGLAGMRERLVLLGGQLEIDSSPGGGTRVVARLPRSLAFSEANIL